MKKKHTFSEEETNSILENLNTAVFRTYLEGSAPFIDVNPAFLKMFAYDNIDEIHAASELDLYCDSKERDKLKKELFSVGRIKDKEVRLKRKDGSIFHGRVSSVVVKDDNGENIYVEGLIDDISELKSHEMELLAERQIFFSGPVVLIQWPLNDKDALLNISENVNELLGFDATDFLSGKILYPDLVHPDDKPALQEHIRSVLSDGSDIMLVHPYRVKQKSGDYIWVQDYANIQRDETGNPKGILGYIYDVTAQKLSEKESLENESRLRDLVENSPTGILSIDCDGNILEVNQRMVDLLGSPSKAATQGFNMFEFQPLVDAGISAKFKKAIVENTIVSFTGKYTTNWGKTLHFNLVISPVLDAENVIVGAQANMEDVTDAYLAEADKRKVQLEQLEERKIFMAGPIMIIRWAYSADDPVISVSENVEQILGYTVEEFQSHDIVPSKVIHPDDLEAVRKSSREAIASGVSSFETVPYRLRKKDGEYIWVGDYSTIHKDEDGVPLHFTGLVWDISRRVEVLEELRSAVKEQEYLLREVHHRVKNNMQVIISLLNIQAEYSGDEHLTEVFAATQNRIRSMALIHDKLFKSEKMSAVNFGNYINTLVLQLKSFYAMDPDRIKIHQKIEGMELEISKAIPSGLIVNELVTNAMKFAFPNNREGSISLSATLSDDGEVRIKIGDDGIGLESEAMFSEAKTMGFRIVRILTEQLEGSILLDHSEGTQFTLTFDQFDEE